MQCSLLCSLLCCCLSTKLTYSFNLDSGLFLETSAGDSLIKKFLPFISRPPELVDGDITADEKHELIMVTSNEPTDGLISLSTRIPEMDGVSVITDRYR